jgi:putative addiction module component (TIGR02574 family)
MALTEFEKVRKQASTLTARERAALAHDLVSSLDGEPDENAQSQWEAAIRQRLSELDEGTAQTIDRDELRERLNRTTG